MSPQPVPTPDMFIDPSIRLPAPQPSQVQTPQQSGQAELLPPRHPHHPQYHPAGAARANNLDLLVQASFDRQPAGAPPYDPAVAGQAEYFAQPAAAGPLTTNDGFESELQYYIDGAPSMHSSVWGAPGGMYGYS
jgi:hypothetical protein